MQVPDALTAFLKILEARELTIRNLRQQIAEQDADLHNLQQLTGSLNQQLEDRERAVCKIRTDGTAKEKIIMELKQACDERAALIERLSSSR